MPEPPPKPKKPAEDLHEVERALSVLQGRHPEHERVRREQEESRKKRSAEHERAADEQQRATRKRQMRIGAIAVFAVVIVSIFGLSIRRVVVRRANIEKAGAPYTALGFTVVDTSARGTAAKLETSVDPGCLVVTSTDPNPVKVVHTGGTIEGATPVLFCTCQNDHLVVTSEVSDNGGVVLLRSDPNPIGGSKAFAYAPFKPATTARTDEACNDATLDAWIAAKKYPDPKPDEAWLAAPARAPLGPSHAKALASLAPGAPFVVVDVPKESCVLVTSDNASDKLSIRTKGGAQPFPPVTGAFAWCEAEAQLESFVREGDGKVEIVAIPAAAVGGMLGIREVAKKAGIELAFTGLPNGDHAWNAKTLLLASTVPENLIQTAAAPDIPPDPDARLVALSFGTPNALVSESKGEEIYSYCEPSIGDATREALCIFGGEQRWKPSTSEAVGAVARSKLPFWLFGLQNVNDPVALKVAIDLATFARRMKHEGFEPTTIEAVTEVPNGVEVLGRSGEDAVIAVGVMPAPPFIVTYAEGGAPWTLDGEPKMAMLQPLQKVTLVTNVKLTAVKERRRSVVFRRQKK